MIVRGRTVGGLGHTPKLTRLPPLLYTQLRRCATTRQSLLEKWEKEEGEGVDKDAYPEWAEALLKDEDRLLRYCGRE